MTTLNSYPSVIVFSKDRPLQLEAYLESLICFSNIPPSCISVIYKATPEIDYAKIINLFQNVIWVSESDFMSDVLKLINKGSEYIMFGCDDVVFKSKIDFKLATDVLSNSPSVFGFSLRLGENIKPVPKNADNLKTHLIWNWQSCKERHYNYPWELDATVYRKADVLDIVSKFNPAKITNPNFFESEVATQPLKYISKPSMASFTSGKCIVLTINRVQEDFLNEFDNTFKTDVKSLYQLHLDDCKLDFTAISKMKHKNIHVGAAFFKLSGKNKPSISVIKYASFYLKKMIAYSKHIIRKAFKL